VINSLFSYKDRYISKFFYKPEVNSSRKPVNEFFIMILKKPELISGGREHAAGRKTKTPINRGRL
jgi:hypothetical protein